MNITIERSNTLNRGNLIAFVDVCVDGMFIIKGCKIFASNNGGQFVGMPSQKNEKDGKYYDHVMFKTREQKDEFSHLVTSAFRGNSGSSAISAQDDEPLNPPRTAPKGPIAWEE